MPSAILEHINVTVIDVEKTAQELCSLFDWKIRWSGEAIYGGKTIHVGADEFYLALYQQDQSLKSDVRSHDMLNGLNHIGIVVEDLDLIEHRISALGYKTGSHADYEPGKRYYFMNRDNVEFEIISYAS